MNSFITPDYIVLAAGGVFTLAYLIINQVGLRIAVLIGTGLYIWYYCVAADEPLWSAIWTSIAMGIANLIGLSSLWLRNSRLSIPHNFRDVYFHFSVLPPGDFRKLMSAAARTTRPAGYQLTTNDARVSTLYYVISGQVAVDKFGERFMLPDGIFVGEVGYLTGNRASATTVLVDDCDVLEWDVTDLKSRALSDVRFKLAMDAMVSLDLAGKVARAGSPHTSISPQEH